MKVAIGIPTYNDYSRVDNLLASLFTLTDYDLTQVGIVVLDDGTPDNSKVEGLKKVCEKHSVDFIKHEKNRGIPAAWNSLTRHFDSEYMVLFNDDIQICDKNWLKCFIYFLDNNEKVVNAGFPLIQIDVATGKPRDTVAMNYDGVPGKVGAPVGCSFGFKRKAFDEVGGFWEDIKSFYEESVSENRYTVIKNSNNFIEVIKFSELFDRFKNNAIKINSKKDVIDKPDVMVLSGKLNDGIEMKRKFLMTDKEREVYDCCVENKIDIYIRGAKRKVYKFFPKTSIDAVRTTIGRIKKKLNRESLFEGVWRPINKIIRKKSRKDIINITQKYGETEVTPDHSLISLENGKIKKRTPQEMLINNLPFSQVITIPENNEFITKIDLVNYLDEDKRIKIEKNKIIYKIQDGREVSIKRYIKEGENLSDWCEVIGWYVSEGCIVRGSFATTLMCNNDYDLLKKTYKVIKRVFCFARMTKTAVVSGYGLVGMIMKNMCGRGSKQVHLPNFIFNIKNNYKKITLNALIDGDGFTFNGKGVKKDLRYSDAYRNKFFGYTTISIKLASQLFVLFKQLNIRAIVRKRRFDNDNWSDSYEIRSSCQYHNFRLKTKIVKNDKEKKENYVYDLEVEDTNMFIDACGFILLHNTDFGFNFAKKNYYSYMMPYPAMEHWGSQTFAKNFELNIQEPINLLPMDEYKKIMLQKYPIERIEPIPGKVYRMDYSRVLFAKKWGCSDYWDIPQVEVHEKYVNALKPLNVKWLDKDMVEKEGVC